MTVSGSRGVRVGFSNGRVAGRAAARWLTPKCALSRFVGSLIIRPGWIRFSNLLLCSGVDCVSNSSQLV